MSTPGTRPTTIVPLSWKILLSQGPVRPRSTGSLGACGAGAGLGRFAIAAPALGSFTACTIFVGRAALRGWFVAVVGRSRPPPSPLAEAGLGLPDLPAGRAAPLP